ncbi:MAG: glycosyltransferase family 2 protein [Elusimicrobia bacterium]|nr:glycosyltransferase family 2 protein [Elusimicrobiota bacterium]
MKKKDTLLTIVIPTYNRAVYLEKQLGRLRKQNDDRIEVLVSDNGSTDQTAGVVARFQKDMGNLFYSKNTENIGFDRNILKLYVLARSAYIWFLSDDDAILEGAVRNVLEFVASYQPTVAVLAAAKTESEVSNWEAGSKSIEIFESLKSVPDYSLFTRIIFVSGLIVRKEQKIGEAVLGKFLDSKFFHVSLSLILLSQRFMFCLAPRLAVVYREPGFVAKSEAAQLCFSGPAKAMNLPEYGYDLKKTRSIINKDWKAFIILLLTAKMGLCSINSGLSRNTAQELRTLLGIRILLFVWLGLKIYRFIPPWWLKGFYWVRCVLRYGIGPGVEYFRSRTRQAFSTKASDA